MGDHFVLLMDRLLTESTLQAAIESRNREIQSAISVIEKSKTNDLSKKVDFGDVSSPRKLVECRICHDEDEDSNMETPCSCSGTLKLGKMGPITPFVSSMPLIHKQIFKGK
ncbi:hypothetical protein L484_025875 [Morus notabilis]|uniref:RING-CH-type domain-containing protein n=1 Tax=Morus notabilis TaxID=981085 RepID=W9RAT4_9ROSA|nr:hypothetical protein L484_025875 [Morus notabilis]